LSGGKLMKRRLIETIIILMLVTTTTSAYGYSDDKDEYAKPSLLQEDLVINIYQSPLFFGLKMDIENTGSSDLTNLEWSFRSKASISATGLFLNEKLQQGVIDELGSGVKKTIDFKPLSLETRSPIGFGNAYLNATVDADGISLRTEKRANLFGLFLFTFRDTYMDIKPPEAYERYLEGEFDLIIDVVGLDIYSLGHLPGAVNYVWADGTLNEKIPTLDKDLTYLVYCHTDPPSTASAQAMVDAGFEHIYRLEGNFKAWNDAGYPVET
jgi:rhodanese-related sulfurtransferase